MKYLLKGGMVVDPVAETVAPLDILVDEGKIVAMHPGIEDRNAEVLVVEGNYVFPGFIDIHCHLREPGEELKETILTGTRAAAKGGFTAVACMGNTKPPADNGAVVTYIKEKAQRASFPVYPIGCATKERKGEEPAEIGDLKEAGVVALSDDGDPIMNAEVLRRVMEYARMFELPVISHCEDKNLSGSGVMHEGYISTLLGLEGIPAAAEEVHVARDLILAAMTGVHLHVAHVSTAGSVHLIREAKKRGVSVTAEVTPHHLCLTAEAVRGYDTNTKVNPPLRTKDDIRALLEGLKDGTIDVIATDHAPHRREEKEVEYNYAPFGISGLETAVPLMWEYLVARKVLSPVELAKKMALNPARIIGLPDRVIKVGGEANITVVDPDLKRPVVTREFLSLGKNNPFEGRLLRGWPVLTMIRGEVRFAWDTGYNKQDRAVTSKSKR
ncbi:MAG: Dihydroorotase [Thermacetogenium phaeum]|uniref:Dihydroorotase n=1 Tax=Thermacetogenium phaeum TaxID=85874 RepID=A0A101FGK1_9THEO|nr:MAG: Dihydroorotase [Thermacetogenium phaeum]